MVTENYKLIIKYNRVCNEFCNFGLNDTCMFQDFRGAAKEGDGSVVFYCCCVT